MTILAYEVRRVTVDPLNWSPVYTPMDCNGVRLSRGRENDSIRVRTADNDPSTEIEVIAGTRHEIFAHSGSFTAVFEKGTRACFVQAKSAAGTVIAEFIR